MLLLLTQSLAAIAASDSCALTLTESAAVTVYVAAAETASLTLTEATAIDQTTVDVSASGGWDWFNSVDAERTRRRARLAKQVIDDGEIASITAEIDREIAQLLSRQEALDAERRELERLRTLARSYDGGAVDARFDRAIAMAANARSLAAARVLEMEAQRVVEEEEFLMTAALLVIDD